MRRLAAAVLLALPLVLALAGSAGAQCAMCQTALMNSPEGHGMTAEFNRAILVMLFAPYAVFGAVGTILLRHRIAAALLRRRRPARPAPGVPPLPQLH